VGITSVGGWDNEAKAPKKIQMKARTQACKDKFKT